MKKSIALITGLALSCSVVGMNAFAADEPSSESAPLKANVLVTVSDGTKLALPQADVLVTDLNGDEKLSIDETLVAAHDQFFEGGAAAGLWGIENGGSYGFYVNSNLAWSLNDEVKENDYLDAFVYSDTKSYSDAYSFFDIREKLGTEVGDTLSLTLSKIGFDPTTYAPTKYPVVGAEITINGKGTGVLTDAEGKATITLENDSDANIKAVISAKSGTETLVPPVCLADINLKEEETEPETTTIAEPTTSDDETTTEAETSSAETTSETAAQSTETSTSATSAGAVDNANNDSPKTGDAGTGAVAAVLGCTVLAAFALKRKDV